MRNCALRVQSCPMRWGWDSEPPMEEIGCLLAGYHTAARQIEVASQRPSVIPLADVPRILLSAGLSSCCRDPQRAADIRRLAGQLAADLEACGHPAGRSPRPGLRPPSAGGKVTSERDCRRPGRCGAFVWLGMVLAISCLEAPLKFRAPGVTIRIGLGIGRLVFRALNLAEAVLAVAVLAAVIAGGAPAEVTVLTAVVAVLLAMQLAVIRPRLSRHSSWVLAGAELPRSRARLS